MYFSQLNSKTKSNKIQHIHNSLHLVVATILKYTFDILGKSELMYTGLPRLPYKTIMIGGTTWMVYTLKHTKLSLSINRCPLEYTSNIGVWWSGKHTGLWLQHTQVQILLPLPLFSCQEDFSHFRINLQSMAGTLSPAPNKVFHILVSLNYIQTYQYGGHCESHYQGWKPYILYFRFITEYDGHSTKSPIPYRNIVFTVLSDITVKTG